MKNKFELTVLLKSVGGEEAWGKVAERIEKMVKAVEGKVERVQEMGKKQLAYKISGQIEAVYVNFRLELPAAAVVQLGRKLAVDKDVIRHLLVKADG